MADRCLLYYITDRTQLPGDEGGHRRALLAKIADATHAGVDYIQLREKDLSARQLEQLAREAVRMIQGLRAESRELRTCLLINSRTDVALAVGADGVHLRSDDISPAEVSGISTRCGADIPFGFPLGFARGFGKAGRPVRDKPLIAVSCHDKADVVRAESEGANFAVFAPVFEKRDRPDTQPTGLAALREACQANIPVLALGGVTLDNAGSCLEAGAAGIAAIRLFQENKIEDVVRALRAL
jgi:thiamine-phosphate pyrophosphorylase